MQSITFPVRTHARPGYAGLYTAKIGPLPAKYVNGLWRARAEGRDYAAGSLRELSALVSKGGR